MTYTYPQPGVKFISQTTPTTCTAFDGSLTIEGNGGQPPYLYSMDREHYQTSGTFTNLPQNWFEYQVKDGNGCIGYYTVFALFAPNCPFGFAIAAGAPNCSPTGSASLTGLGGTPPYQYSKDGIHFQDDGNLTGLPLGIDVVYAKDANNDTMAYGLQLFGYCGIEVQAEVTDIPCYNPDNSIQGSIVVTAANGVAPYQYTIDGTHYQASNRFDHLPFGTYSILAKDAEGKLAAVTAEVKGGCLVMIVEPIAATCNGNDGSVQATASGGTAPYQYSTDGITFQDNGLFTMVKKGTYTVTARDANGATVSQENVVIKNSEGPLIDKATPTPASCNTADGTLTMEASGGLSPLMYSTDGINYQASNVFTGLGSGSYDAVVKDANGCKNDICCYTVLYNCVAATAAAANAACGQKDGSVALSATGGTAPYRYSADGVHYQTSNLFTNLTGGTYTFYIQDNGGLSATVSATVAQVCIAVQTVVTNATCDGDNGTLAATASGGTAPYQYSVDGTHYQDAGLFANLPKGDYTVTVKDANGVLQTKAIAIANSPSAQVTAMATVASCAGHNGSITLAAARGTAPYLYRMDAGEEQAANLFPHADTGRHTVAVRDANGCVGTASVTVPLTNTLQADAGTATTICEGSSTMLQASPDGASFRWEPAEGLDNPAAKQPAASPLATTQYYLTATMPLCTATDSVVVTVHKAPVADAGADVSVCYGKPVSLTGGGGTSYRWQPAAYLSDASLPNPLVKCPAGRYTYLLSVADDKGCRSVRSDTVVVFVTPPAKVFAGRDTAVTRGLPFPLQADDVNHSGFTAYEWMPAAGLSDAGIANPVATVTQDTRYRVTAYTADGCAGTDTILLKVYAGPDIYVPTAFSPNGDGRNDVVRAMPIGIVSFRYFAIYDRFGKQVFYTTQPERGWDGTINATGQHADVYVWMTAGIDSNHRLIERKGTLVLLK